MANNIRGKVSIPLMRIFTLALLAFAHRTQAGIGSMNGIPKARVDPHIGIKVYVHSFVSASTLYTVRVFNDFIFIGHAEPERAG
ncbi:hypothetical protein K0M31_013595 [Melipona bicolor]|uniref:Uncharacterized protein n=1 Tax=Melipona bicolor TaxID=60889 RepID=A0AA40FHC4_9HYME|nr:hypothetical protein K0M31_013595 [Melipona bicolor]